MNQKKIYLKEKTYLQLQIKYLTLFEFKKEQTEALDEMKKEKNDEELFLNDTFLAAANKVFDYEKFKKQQEDAIRDFKKKLVEDAETINYAYDLDISELKENKNLKIAAKKVSNKYRKQRKRRAATRIPELQEIVEDFILPEERKRRQTDKTALLAAKKISQKYKNGQFR